MLNYYGFGWGMGLFGALIMVLFWVAVFWFIIWLTRQTNQQRFGNGKGRNHLDIIKERYAKGEITKKEFEQMKKICDK